MPRMAVRARKFQATPRAHKSDVSQQDGVAMATPSQLLSKTSAALAITFRRSASATVGGVTALAARF